ncbi:MAG TPA: EAL domain-containing protein [Thermoanaerobaculia bacterium]|nr:EAL domain-containing protein [Thermoanaerobaculia bacterium]
MRSTDALANEMVAVFRQTPEGHLLDCNDVCAHMLGYASREELLATGAFEYQNASDLTSVATALRDLGSLSNVEIALRKKGGGIAWVLQNLKLVSVDEASKVWIEGAMFDVTEQRVAAQRFEYQAYHDTLTLLPNRMLFIDRLNVALAQSRRRKAHVSVFMVDLDRFDIVNNALGRGMADRLLRSVADRLNATLREEDSLSRFSGDEFVFHVGDTGSGTESAIVAQRVLDAMARPFNVGGRALELTASLGIAMSDRDASDAEALVRHASTAMFRAKEFGRNLYQFYDDKLNAHTLERLALVSSVRRGLDRGEFELFFQPEVDVQTGRIECVEAFLRWRHPDLGIIGPAEFLGVAEEAGLGSRIAQFVISSACQQARTWADAGMQTRVAINLSSRDFNTASLPRHIEQAVRESGLDAQTLELEVAHASLNDCNRATEILQTLKELGVLLAIDDFGSGGCSFADLKQLPVDTIKIAPSFVQNMIRRQDDAAIVQAMITMAKGFDMRVVAEGVETKEQLSYLLNRRCTEMQGFFLGKPLPADSLSEVLRMQH